MTAGTYPASVSQRLLWQAIRQSPPRAAATPRWYSIRDIDPAALHRALDDLRGRHEALRTRLVGAGPRLAQQVSSPEPLPVEWVNEVSADQVRHEMLTVPPTSPGQEVVVRVLRTGADGLLLINVDHLLTDAWSARILGAELASLYEAYRSGRAPDLPPVGWQYRQFAEWQTERLRGETLGRLQLSWLKRLDGAEAARLPGPRLPGEGTRVERNVRASAVARLPNSPALLKALQALSLAGTTTVASAALTVFFLELMLITGQDDIAIGSAFANRVSSQVWRTVGLFAHVLPLRLAVDGAWSVTTALRGTHELMSHALENQELPLSLLPAGSLTRETAIGIHNVIFHVLPTGMLGAEGGKSAIVRAPSITSGAARFDMEFALIPSADNVRGFIRYSSDRLSAQWIDEFSTLFAALAEAAAADPEGSVHRLGEPFRERAAALSKQ
jgi:hypothetical protein